MTNEVKRQALQLSLSASQLPAHRYVGVRQRHIDPSTATFDPDDPVIKRDINLILLDYLKSQSMSKTVSALEAESRMQINEQVHHSAKFQKLLQAIKAGDWSEAENLCTKHTTRNYKAVLYEIYKQQFLELIDRQESQRAFSFLMKRLKPFEALMSQTKQSLTPNTEFSELCYLLTCKSVVDSPAFRDWQGAVPGRARLVQHVTKLVRGYTNKGLEVSSLSDAKGSRGTSVPSNRLVHLLQQAVAYQIEFNKYHPRTKPRVHTLLEDYTSLVLPNQPLSTLRGHTANVKSVDFIGSWGMFLVSGSSDHTVRLWRSHDGEPVATLAGHSSRVWHVTSTLSGRFVASSSADSTVNLWDVSGLQAARFVPMHPHDTHSGREAVRSKSVGPASSSSSSSPSAPSTPASSPRLPALEEHRAPVLQLPSAPVFTLDGHQGDVYTSAFHPRESYIATAGYDCSIRVYDMDTQKLVRTFQGHSAPVTSLRFSRRGDVLVSGSKDSTIRFWDTSSGVCTNVLGSHVWEVTSVDINTSDTRVLTSSRDNANRIWDLRSTRNSKPLKRLKGHQNTLKNFVRSSFGPNDAFVVGGSEDGCVYVWDIETEKTVQVLKGHSGIVFDAVWNPHASLLASCSDDLTLRTWWSGAV